MAWCRRVRFGFVRFGEVWRVPVRYGAAMQRIDDSLEWSIRCLARYCGVWRGGARHGKAGAVTQRIAGSMSLLCDA